MGSSRWMRTIQAEQLERIHRHRDTAGRSAVVTVQSETARGHWPDSRRGARSGQGDATPLPLGGQARGRRVRHPVSTRCWVEGKRGAVAIDAPPVQRYIQTSGGTGRLPGFPRRPTRPSSAPYRGRSALEEICVGCSSAFTPAPKYGLGRFSRWAHWRRVGPLLVLPLPIQRESRALPKCIRAR
jgi:hypothetical protein